MYWAPKNETKRADWRSVVLDSHGSRPHHLAQWMMEGLPASYQSSGYHRPLYVVSSLSRCRCCRVTTLPSPVQYTASSRAFFVSAIALSRSPIALNATLRLWCLDLSAEHHKRLCRADSHSLLPVGQKTFFLDQFEKCLEIFHIISVLTGLMSFLGTLAKRLHPQSPFLALHTEVRS